MVHNLADIRYNIEKANRTDRKVQNLACFIDVNLLKTIHYRMAKGKASGVDGVTKEEYEVNLDENLEALVARMKNGTYRPNPSRRVYIPKVQTSSTFLLFEKLIPVKQGFLAKPPPKSGGACPINAIKSSIWCYISA